MKEKEGVSSEGANGERWGSNLRLVLDSSEQRESGRHAPNSPALLLASFSLLSNLLHAGVKRAGLIHAA